MGASRPIKSGLKSRRIMIQEEKPIRWPFMKILRETSSLKEFYPDINPYAEAYRFRENIWAIFTESLDGAGDPWIFLIVGPQRALLIDTSYGLGDLKGLCDHLSGGKPLIVANTHHHIDHALGNPQFDEIWCHEYEAPYLERHVNNPHLWDHMFDENGVPKYAEFDPADMVSFSPFEIKTFTNHHEFDLGDGYIVEAIWLPGHTPGHCGFLDRQRKVLVSGDTTMMGACDSDLPYAEYAVPEALDIALGELMGRLDEIEGVCPGHGMFDIGSNCLEYLHDATQAVLANPHNYDKIRTFVYADGEHTVCTKNIYEWSCIRYDPDHVTVESMRSSLAAHV